MNLKESIVEDAALEWFGALGYAVGHGPDFSPGEPTAERDSYGEVVLVGRLRAAIRRLNPAMPEEAREEALRKVLRVTTPSLIQSNRAFHTMLRDGVPVEYPRPDGGIAGDHARLVDFDDPAANDWLVVNQFTVIEGRHHRRLDLVVFVNGLPLSLIELKNAADEDATIWGAYAQLKTYQVELPSLFVYNAALVVSDGLQARMGSVTASQEWFKVWRTIDGEGDAPKTALELEVLVRGVFDRRRFLDLLQHFIVFEEDPDSGALHKIIAGYHQFHAVNAAVEETVRASGMAGGSGLREAAGAYWAGRMHGGQPGDRRAGVVWHTQGSGKSFSMLFFAARVIREPVMQNPTLVVLTDRNDLDDQLFGQFQRCHDLLGQMPVQAASREQLRELLAVASGGVVFTTIQKFLPMPGERMPCLSARRNIVVIADEAHRSQYDLIDGLARHLRDALPNASFIGFTGTPIEKTDANTRAVFGDYISIYDIQRAVADQATVPIYYESRIAKLGLNAAALPSLDAEFEEITEGEEPTKKERLKTKWAALEALVGDPKRIALVAADLVAHYEKRVEALDGQVIDIFTAAGLPRPDIGILSDAFLAEVRGLQHKNVAAELLEKLLKDELKIRARRNLVQSQVFSEKLKKTLNAYHNRAISSLHVIEELIQLARELDAASKRGEALGLTDDEIAFYDALARNESAVMAMGDDKLKVIAAELITQVRKSVTIDWTLRESARARIRVMVKRILNKYGYPPDLQEDAVKTVLAQAELLSAAWVEETVTA